MEIGTFEAEPIWTEFLRKLTRRGLRGVKLVISDAHKGLKPAVTRVLCATWQRCRVHFMRNVLAHAGKRRGQTSVTPRNGTRSEARIVEANGRISSETERLAFAGVAIVHSPRATARG